MSVIVVDDLIRVLLVMISLLLHMMIRLRLAQRMLLRRILILAYTIGDDQENIYISNRVNDDTDQR